MTSIAIDPRLRDRRIAVRRAQGRRRLRRIVIVATLVAAAGVSWLVVRSPLLDVDRVAIHGLDRVSLGAAEDALGVGPGAAMMDVDADAAEARLEAIPWVLDAQVQRRWPGTVEVEISERTPVAVTLVDTDTWVLIDAQGRVLSGPLLRDPGLPRLSGIRGAGEPGSFLHRDSAALLALVTVLPEPFAERVSGIWRDSRGEIWMGLVSEDDIVLGDDLDLRAKVAAALAMVEHLDAEGRVGWELDVSVPTLPSLRDRPSPTGVLAAP